MPFARKGRPHNAAANTTRYRHPITRNEMSNGTAKKTKVRRFAKVLGVVVLLVIGLFLFANIKAGNTPLHWAAAKNMAETAEVLLTQGANVNEKDKYGNILLHTAAWNNANETAELLLTQGADVNAKADKGRTPLHYVARENAYKTAELLNRYGGRASPHGGDLSRLTP